MVSSTLEKAHSSWSEKWQKCVGVGGEERVRKKDVDGPGCCNYVDVKGC